MLFYWRAKIRHFSFEQKLNGLFLPIKQVIFFETHKYPLFPDFYRICFEEIPFAAYISSVLQPEFIPVQRTNNIPQCIDIPMGHQSTCMRAFLGTSHQLVLMQGNANRLTPHHYRCHCIGRKGNLRHTVCQFMPAVIFLFHFR